jgi:hypothetical protein
MSMGYGLSVFLVPGKKLAAIPGSGDQRQLEHVLNKMASSLASYDEQMVDVSDPNDLTHGQALREIFEGHFSKPRLYSRYGWALEILCDFLGERLDNGPFCPCDDDWYEQLDEVLEEAGVPIRFLYLTGNPPIPLPSQNDWPEVGHWTNLEIRQAAPLLVGRLLQVEDEEVGEALEAMQGWLGQAAKVRGSILVGFHG